MGRQDLNIFWQIVESYRGVVVVVNKWDLVEKETNTMRDMEEMIRERTSPFTDIPIVFTSNVKSKGCKPWKRLWCGRRRTGRAN